MIAIQITTTDRTTYILYSVCCINRRIINAITGAEIRFIIKTRNANILAVESSVKFPKNPRLDQRKNNPVQKKTKEIAAGKDRSTIC